MRSSSRKLVCCTISRNENGNMRNSLFLPVNGSLTFDASSNELLPVAMTCTPVIWSVMSFMRSPMSVIRCASSITMILLLPIIARRRVDDILRNISCTSVSSPLSHNVSLLLSNIILSNVDFPTWRAPIMIIALLPWSKGANFSSSIRCIIINYMSLRAKLRINSAKSEKVITFLECNPKKL